MDDTKLERPVSDRKPIFVIQIAHTPPELGWKLREYLNERGIEKEYYVIIVLGNENKFQLFSDKEIEPIQIDELKELLKL